MDQDRPDSNILEFSKHVYCPWCGRGKTMADTTANIRISTQCPRCGHLYIIDWQTLRTIKVSVNPKVYRQSR